MSYENRAKPAVFLDRDGTLIREVGYLRRRDQVEVLPGVPEAIRLLRERGFSLVVVTNQSAVARGLLTEEELGLIHQTMRARLENQGAPLDAIYYCPHHPTEGKQAYRRDCDCRKPKPGLIAKAATDLGLDPLRSYVVGDAPRDMELADRVGAKGVLIAAESPAVAPGSRPRAAAADLWAAAQWIVNDCSPSKKSPWPKNP